MGLAARLALAIAILLLDLVTFFIPLGALVVAWVIVARPRWALELIVKLYDGVDFSGAPRSPDKAPGAPPN